MSDTYDVMLKILGIYRHEFLNQLQVVGGMAQLNKTEKLLSFIRKASDDIHQFGRLAACGDPYLCLLIYERFLQETEFDVQLEVRGRLPELSPSTLEYVASRLDVFCSSVKALGPCKVAVTIKAGSQPCLELQISSDADDACLQAVLEACACMEAGREIILCENKLTLLLDKS